VAASSGLVQYAWALQVGNAKGLMAANGEGTILPTPAMQIRILRNNYQTQLLWRNFSFFCNSQFLRTKTAAMLK